MYPISINNQTNSYRHNFTGSIDKSLINYLKEVRSDVVMTKGSGKLERFVEPQKNNIINAKLFIENILKKLHAFMEQTHSNTKLVLGDSFPDEARPLIFVNTKLGSKIKGFQNRHLGLGQVDYEGVGVNPPNIRDRQLPDDELKSILGFKKPHSMQGLKELNDWVNSLTAFIDPKSVDRAIFDKMILKMSQKAKSSNFIGRLVNKYNGYKADKLAKEFGRKPVYTEKFQKIAHVEKQRQIRVKNAYNDVAKYVEDLENLEIK